MQVLAIETSTLTGSVALMSGDRLVGETTLSVSVRHSERLMPAVEQLLRDANTLPSQVDLFAVAEGPGSFTGLRIGIAAAQGLALAQGKPLVGVSTLQGLAMNAVFHPGLVVPVLNAFRGEVYFGIYRTASGRPIPVQEETVVSLDDFMALLDSQGESTLVLGDGVALCLPKMGSATSDKITFDSGPLSTPRASNLAFLALSRKAGERAGPVLPRYLRKPG
ncbi:MAG TPA: tRNA (adenosine(37)-N6)-threonylcarbamoyltransferase complex dimerization subunit type 1 TsaB [bacterium]|nr:tRNA (adenosine(37)-N6)-threonylcarbamoyltransferase complex dimerization subunit type 1 TsaB [bacterium]